MLKMKQVILILLFSVVWVLPISNFAATPLSTDQAFVFSAVVNKNNLIKAEWQIAPGYYLYRQRMDIKVGSNASADIRYPQGEVKYDADHGRYEVFSGNLSIPVQLKTNAETLRLSVSYQGCSKEGFCYPPVHKDIILKLTGKTIPPNNNVPLQTLLTDQKSVQTLLQSGHLGMTLLLFVGLGLLLAFTPCVLPMVPILTSIIVGQKGSLNTRKASLLSITYVMGMSITYAIAGLVVAYLGNSLQVWLQTPWIIGATCGLFVLLALSLFGFYDLRLPRRWHNHLSSMSNQQQGGTYTGVFLMGVLSSLIVSPCVTAPLVGVLMYIAQSGSLVLGASALFAMGIGMGLPLILIGISAGKLLPKSGPWMEVVKKVFGILMLGMAIWLLSRIISTTIVIVLWGVLLLGIALFFGFYLPGIVSQPKLHRSLGVLVGISGMLLMVGAVSMPDVMNKWANAGTIAATKSFIVVRDVTDLEKQLSLAKAAHRPVVVDFYADWCDSCVSMDRHVFAVPHVQHELTKYVLLRADITANTSKDEALLKNFKVIAPPTVLFFDSSGHESERIEGEVSAKEFLSRLNEAGSQS